MNTAKFKIRLTYLIAIIVIALGLAAPSTGIGGMLSDELRKYCMQKYSGDATGFTACSSVVTRIIEQRLGQQGKTDCDRDCEATYGTMTIKGANCKAACAGLLGY